MRFALKVFYRGRNFSGSQIQPEVRTVEGELQRALKKLGKARNFQCAGRTDRGVSALGNVFFVSADFKIRASAVNTYLPEDLQVLAVAEIPEDSKARKSARERIYKYFLYGKEFELKKITDAARVFEGTHSFHNFSKTEKGQRYLRKINYIKTEKKDSVIILTISGDSFLWQMIRRMITLIKKAGRKEIEPEQIKKYFDLNLKEKIPPAKPEPLVLWDVKYPFDFEEDAYAKRRFVKYLLREKKDMQTELSMIKEMEKS